LNHSEGEQGPECRAVWPLTRKGKATQEICKRERGLIEKKQPDGTNAGIQLGFKVAKRHANDQRGHRQSD
jgi:hypothetical protein